VRIAGLPQGTRQKVGSTRFTRSRRRDAGKSWGELHRTRPWPLAEHATDAACRSSALCGPPSFHGGVCCRLGNGTVGDEPALIVNWLKRHQANRAYSCHQPEVTQSARSTSVPSSGECRRLGVRSRRSSRCRTSDDGRTGRQVCCPARGNADAWSGSAYGGLVVSGTVRGGASWCLWLRITLFTVSLLYCPARFPGGGDAFPARQVFAA